MLQHIIFVLSPYIQVTEFSGRVHSHLFHRTTMENLKGSQLREVGEKIERNAARDMRCRLPKH